MLAAIGCLPPGRIAAAAADIYRAGIHSSGTGLRIRLIAVGCDRSVELAEHYPEVTQLIWPDLLTFIWDRFQTYRKQKTQVDQWGIQGREIKRLADASTDPKSFVDEALRLMGVRNDNAAR